MKPEINPLSRLIADKLNEVNPETLTKSREKNMIKTKRSQSKLGPEENLFNQP